MKLWRKHNSTKFVRENPKYKLVTKEEKNKGDKTENKYEHNIRKCELLSENLHQYLSGVVTSRLHNQGVYLIDDENVGELNISIEEYRRLPYLSLMQNLFDKKDTELTRKRTELIAKSESIVVEMEKKRAENYQITTRRNWRSYG